MGRTYNNRQGTTFYPCGGCGKRGAYVTERIELGALVYDVHCRYCGGWAYHGTHHPKDRAAACAALQRGGRQHAR